MTKSWTKPSKRIAKADLPSKDCVVCGRPFVWRKKWRKDWEQVRYCSERCRRQRSHSATESRAGENE